MQGRALYLSWAEFKWGSSLIEGWGRLQVRLVKAVSAHMALVLAAESLALLWLKRAVKCVFFS